MELVVKEIIFNIKFFVAHSDRALQNPTCSKTSPILKVATRQRAKVRGSLVKHNIGIRLTKCGALWNSR